MRNPPHSRIVPGIRGIAAGVVAAALLIVPAGQAIAQIEALTRGAERQDPPPETTNPALARDKIAIGSTGPTHRVGVAPPENKNDVKPAAPSPAHIWLPGFWNWQEGHYVWVAGHWEAPKQNVVWVTPQWVFLSRQWAFYPGHWAHPVAVPPQEETQPPQSDVVVKIAPPPHRTEILGTPPSSQHKWFRGYWSWNPGKDAHFSWNAGFWAVPQTGWTWQQAHWLQMGQTWRFVPGHWTHK